MKQLRSLLPREFHTKIYKVLIFWNIQNSSWEEWVDFYTLLQKEVHTGGTSMLHFMKSVFISPYLSAAQNVLLLQKGGFNKRRYYTVLIRNGI